MVANFNLACVLFDLDGTLVDTAADLVTCLNQALDWHGLAQVSHQSVLPFISYGAESMIYHSVKNINQHTRNNILKNMLMLYEKNIAVHSKVFLGITDTLNTIDSLGLKWGIVTNKLTRFTNPLITALKLNNRAACIISGDTTANIKPHPEPMFAACVQANVKPQNCVYIGDTLIDIKAGKNANMQTLAALYGYLKPDDNPNLWGAEALIKSPKQLTSWIIKTCR